MNFWKVRAFTEHKFAQQQSGFKNLLKPKAGGMAFAMSAMGDKFRSVLDVTIYYPQGIPSFWDFMQGKCNAAPLLLKKLPFPRVIKWRLRKRRTISLEFSTMGANPLGRKRRTAQSLKSIVLITP